MDPQLHREARYHDELAFHLPVNDALACDGCFVANVRCNDLSAGDKFFSRSSQYFAVSPMVIVPCPGSQSTFCWSVRLMWCPLRPSPVPSVARPSTPWMTTLRSETSRY